MHVKDIGKDGYGNFPFHGGPLDGQVLTVAGSKKPRSVKLTQFAEVWYLDDDRGSLPSEWVKHEYTVYAGSYEYEWSPSTCAYVRVGTEG